MRQPNTVLLSGNHAVAHAVKLARPAMIPVYPITPQSPIMEKITALHTAGELEAEVLTPESEHSVMAACVSASLTGVRVFTATASQGLFLMHEMLHWASGARAPIVMFNVNRTIGSPWGFWPDQTDSIAQRDTGWIQYYSESAQESLDTTIQAFKVAEEVSLPVMISHEAFYVSHSLEAVKLPEQSLVDGYLPPYQPEHMLDPDRGESWGNVVNQEMYRRHRRDIGEAMDKAVQAAQKADADWQYLTGRGYGIYEKYRCEDAETIIVTMGSIAGTAREAVDSMREDGLPVGLLKIRLFRPFPVEELRIELSGIPRLVVMDRNFSPGLGGVLHQELKSALYGVEKPPEIHGLLTGVGGANVSPQMLEQLVKKTLQQNPSAKSVWTG